MVHGITTASGLQKAYDESYLTCSTAVYYEGEVGATKKRQGLLLTASPAQGEEEEALRCWQAALRQILAYKEDGRIPHELPQSETEKALADSLHLLELQCRERVDLLGALRLSRQDESTQPGEGSDGPAERRGWIGGGTIPAVTYMELSRPAIPSRSPSGPTLGSPTASPSPGATNRPTMPERLRSGNSLSGTESSGQGASPLHRPQEPRPRSPEKYTLRATLRTGGKHGEKQPRASSRPTPKPGEGPSRAAAAAWGALGFGSRPTRAEQTALSTSQTGTAQRGGIDDKQVYSPATSQTLWDSHSRRLVTSSAGGRPSTEATRPSFRSGETAPPGPASLSVNAAASALHLASTAAPGRPEERPQRRRTAPLPPAAPTFPLPRNSDASGPVSANVRKPRYSGGALPTSGNTGGRKSQGLRGVPGILANPSPAGTDEPVVRSKKETGGAGRAADLGRGASQRLSWPKYPQGEDGYVKPSSVTDAAGRSPDESDGDEYTRDSAAWKGRKHAIVKDLPPGVDEAAAGQILNEILVRGDEVRWSDVAGLEVAKSALREAVVYPFLRPDLFMGLREPIRGILLFGPPGTGKTLLARAVATESRSTFFSISASSLTSKYLGESEKLVRALFVLARKLAPSIIFIDEIDSLLGQRSGSGEHEATRRIKSELLIQWSDLQRAAVGRDATPRKNESGDASRVLVLGATNLPWAIDEAARRRFARRQYIPLPEAQTRESQLKTLLAQQTHSLAESDIDELVELTEGILRPLPRARASSATDEANQASPGPTSRLWPRTQQWGPSDPWAKPSSTRRRTRYDPSRWQTSLPASRPFGQASARRACENTKSGHSNTVREAVKPAADGRSQEARGVLSSMARPQRPCVSGRRRRREEPLEGGEIGRAYAAPPWYNIPTYLADTYGQPVSRRRGGLAGMVIGRRRTTANTHGLIRSSGRTSGAKDDIASAPACSA